MEHKLIIPVEHSQETHSSLDSIWPIKSFRSKVMIGRNHADGHSWNKICSWIGEQRELQQLILPNIECPDENLKILQNFPNLETLNFKSSTLTDRFIDYLPNNNKLKSVGLDIPQLTTTGIHKLLDKSPRISDLAVSLNSIDSNLLCD